MKILVLYQSPWWNAAAYYAFNLVLSLKRLGYEVYFVTKEDTPIANKIVANNFNLINLNLFENNPINFYYNIKKVKQIILDEKINYLFPISAPGHIVCGIIKKIFQPEIPVVKICLDNMSPINNIPNKYLHNSLTDYFIFPGESTQKNYNRFNLKKSLVLHAPIDITSFTNFVNETDIKKYYAIPEDKIIVSFIGRFSPEKGILFLIEIINATLQKTDNAFFILSGSEEQIKFSDVQKRIDELGIANRVKIINKVEDVRKIISITNIGLLSSRYSEFICRIALEFMSFKIPIVAPRVNVIPEVVGSDSNGFIYELNNYNQAADYLLRLINDKLLLKIMGENSFKIIMQNNDYSVFDKQIKSVMAELK